MYGSGGAANWEHSFNESLRDKLGTDLGQYFTPEFLSLIRAAPEDRELIANSLAMKYQHDEITMIVAVLSEANDFVTEWASVFAPNSAILRVLPGDEYLSPARRTANEVILASALPTAVAKTTELLPEFFPDLERIYLIGGAGAGDLEFMNRYRTILDGLQLPWEFQYISGLAPDELITELSQAPPDSAVMTTTYDIDRYGRPLRSLLITEQMVSELNMPIIAMADPQIPVGAIGGNVTTVDAYARTALRLIQGMFAGDFPAEPVTAETDFLFNGEQLDRFNINRNLLPPDSQIINETPNLWRDYSQIIIITTAIIAIQGVLIALLLEARRRRKQAEAALSRANKMEALGTLAGGIAHDFNNILMSIMANAELLAFKLTDEEARGRIGKILNASDKAKNLVGQILMFSRQSAKSEKKILDVRELLEDSAEQIRSLLPAGCTIRIHGDYFPASVLGDPSQLYQVIMNICINAQQAMENEGVIDIEIRNEKLEKARQLTQQTIPPGDYVRIAFSDTGSGIDENNIAHAFEPFFTTKPVGEGTGLGLSLVYQIIKSHQGYINLESEVEVGTTMTIYLPCREEIAAKDKSRNRPQLITGTRERILLVDDDKMVLDANQHIIESLNYSVTSHSSSVAALRDFEQHPGEFKLVFTDLSMPEMDGVRLISNIRRIRPDIPVILCTGYLDALHANDLKDLRVLTKPTSVAEVSQAIRAELDQLAESTSNQ